MKKIAIFIILLLLSLFFAGCAIKRDIQKSESYLITIKIKNMAFNDTGFLKYANHYTELQLFDLSNLVLDIKISDNICINSHCLSKNEFNRRFLSPLYPKTLLENVLNKKPIFKKVGYQKTKDGFLQIIDKKNLHIKYIIRDDKLYFKDFSNHFLIKLKRIKE